MSNYIPNILLYLKDPQRNSICKHRRYYWVEIYYLYLYKRYIWINLTHNFRIFSCIFHICFLFFHNRSHYCTCKSIHLSLHRFSIVSISQNCIFSTKKDTFGIVYIDFHKILPGNCIKEEFCLNSSYIHYILLG